MVHPGNIAALLEDGDMKKRIIICLKHERAKIKLNE